jgi:hypothetical protein
VPANYDPIARSPLADLKQDWRNFQRNRKEWTSLIKLVESGDALAVDLAIKLMPSTDGGNLGDLCRVVNTNIRSNPKLVLGTLRRYAVAPAGFETVLTCLPLDTVDNVQAMIAETEARLAAVSRIDDPQLAEYRRMAIEIYRDQLLTFKQVP